jgi:ferredoxin-NADP reductase
VLDFSGEERHKGYRHMHDQDPRDLNDDYVRTFTVSSCPPVTHSPADVGAEPTFAPTNTLSCIIQKVGRISKLLHARVRDGAAPGPLSVRLVGLGGSFSCFTDSGELKHPRMLWIGAGSGVTPFLSMGAALAERSNADVQVLFSARGAETALAKEIVIDAGNVRVFDTEEVTEETHCANPYDTTYTGVPRRRRRRMCQEDIALVPRLGDRHVYVCGPSPFRKAVLEWLEAEGVASTHVHTESFSF